MKQRFSKQHSTKHSISTSTNRRVQKKKKQSFKKSIQQQQLSSRTITSTPRLKQSNVFTNVSISPFSKHPIPTKFSSMSTTNTINTSYIDGTPTFKTDFISRKYDRVVTNILQAEGDGVSVRRSIGQNPRYYDPFALLDNFIFDRNSVEAERGFTPHPHRGISTLTYMCEGAIEHRDHKGHKGQLFPGDVQYMSAGKGIVHSEMPITNKPINGMQLWINLKQEDKMTEPDYQEYRSNELPESTQGGIFAKVISGEALGVSAKINTKTPVHYIHYKLQPNAFVQHIVPRHWNAFIYVLNGNGFAGPNSTQFATDEAVNQSQTAYFHGTKVTNNENNNNENNNYGITIQAGKNTMMDFVLIAGEPLGEPPSRVVQYGPMIMNSFVEVQQAFTEFRYGLNGFEGAPEFIEKWLPPGAIADKIDDISLEQQHKH